MVNGEWYIVSWIWVKAELYRAFWLGSPSQIHHSPFTFYNLEWFIFRLNNIIVPMLTLYDGISQVINVIDLQAILIKL